MHTTLLIDTLVRQTTVLIARISTASGIRAPLAHVADSVFLKLSSEIQSQGVPQKVAADMFGLALRSYQKKVKRLNDSLAEAAEMTLGQKILDFIEESGSQTRQAIAKKFRTIDDLTMRAVLSDLVGSGFLNRTGQGDSTLYGLTGETDLKKLMQEEQDSALAQMVCLRIYRGRGETRASLAEQLGEPREKIDAVVDELMRMGTIRTAEGAPKVLQIPQFEIPFGAEKGWEAAVFDHFQAMVNAIGQKLSVGPRADRQDEVGGSTMSFDVYPGHPYEAEVRGLLTEFRGRTEGLWDKVAQHNREHAVPHDADKVTFYMGQSIRRGADDS